MGLLLKLFACKISIDAIQDNLFSRFLKFSRNHSYSGQIGEKKKNAKMINGIDNVGDQRVDRLGVTPEFRNQLPSHVTNELFIVPGFFEKG